MKLRHVLLAAYFAICAICLVWPIYDTVGNRLTPFVLGLPLSFAWNVGWVLLTFLVLVAFHLSSGEEG